MSSLTASDFLKSQLETMVTGLSSHLSTWLKENKDVEVTTDELCKAFDVTFKAPSTPGYGSMPVALPTNVPGYFSGTKTAPKRRGGRQKRAVDPNAPRCEYEFTRGKKKGDRCGELCQNDDSIQGSDKYCKACLKKGGVTKLLEDGVSKNMVKPSSAGMVSSVEEPEDDITSLTAEEIPGEPGFVRDLKHGFIIKQMDDSYVVVQIETEEGNRRNLTEEEKTMAQDLGLSVAELDLNIPQVVA